MSLVSLQKELIAKQIQVEEEKLKKVKTELRILELEECRKKEEHNEWLRKLEIKNSLKEQ